MTQPVRIVHRVCRVASARLGEPATMAHVCLFAFLFLVFLVRAVSRILTYLPAAQPEVSAFGPCLPMAGGCMAIFKVHAHLIGFPVLLKLLRLSPDMAWLAGPLLAAVAFVLLWTWLVARHRVPMLLASALVIAIFNLPVLSGMTETPNGDVLTNVLVIALVVVMMEWPAGIVWPALICLAAMLTHQRVMVLLPFLTFLRLAGMGTGLPLAPRPLLRVFIRAVLPFALSLIAFFVFKEVFYKFVWHDPNIYNKLDITSQVYRVFGVNGNPEVSGSIQLGGPLQYVLHHDNWRIWGPLYFISFVAAAFHWKNGTFEKAVAYLLLWLGTVFQLVMAEDVHRLTSFFYVALILFAIDIQAMGKRAQLWGTGFLFLGFAWVFLPNILRLH